MASDGHAGIDAMLASVQAKFPGFVLRRTSEVDCHNGSARFAWSLGPAAGPAVVEGVDFCALAPDGRLEQVVGFIDKMPPWRLHPETAALRAAHSSVCSTAWRHGGRPPGAPELLMTKIRARRRAW